MTPKKIAPLLAAHSAWLKDPATPRANLSGADLTRADLTRADLRWADLRWANLSGASLSGAELIGAKLIGANLNGADLNVANLNGADLNGADLRWADLSGANLRGADLTRANLRGANLAHVMGIVDAGRDCRGYEFLAVKQTDGSYMIKAGCRWFAHREAIVHWRSKGNADALNRVKMLRLLARDKGWTTKSLAPVGKQSPLTGALRGDLGTEQIGSEAWSPDPGYPLAQ